MEPFQIAWIVLKDSARVAPQICPCGKDPCVCGYEQEKPKHSGMNHLQIQDVNKPVVAPRPEDAPGGPDTLTHGLYRRPIVSGE